LSSFLDQTHQVVVITGAAGALGSSFALHLASLGYQLALTDIDQNENLVSRLRDLGCDPYYRTVDLTDNSAVEAFAEHVLERFGRCDVLVNNAAYMPLVPFEELTVDHLKRFEAVNVEASFILAKKFSIGMIEREFGRIIQIASSTTGTPMPNFTAYITTKMAGIGLTRALAAELGSYGVTANAISPGLTRTESSQKNLPQSLFDSVLERQLVKRNGVPKDLCGVLSFLISRDADFISGQVINTDGGVVF
jgi:NAD(P)-dependent dehydrogenase (short-subunit alcohol dehydrogenase family)